MNDGVEPCQYEIEPGSLVGCSHHPRGRDGGESPDQVGLDSRRWLEGEDPARAEQVDRDLGRDLTCQEQPVV